MQFEMNKNFFLNPEKIWAQIRLRTPAAVSGYHPSSAKLAFWTQYIWSW